MLAKNSKKLVKSKNRQHRARQPVQVSWRDVFGLPKNDTIFRFRKEKKEVLEKRMLRFEELEQRLAMSVNPVALTMPVAPEINFGLVYYEDERGAGMDQFGDVFTVSWNGGAEGTVLQELRINLDKNGNGVRDPGECFFDMEGKNGGVYGYSPFTLVSKTGVGSYTYDVEDGGQLLIIRFTDFAENGKFVFSIDVDEWDFQQNGSIHGTALAEGAEFEGSILSCVFAHPDYEIGTGSAVFCDRFADPKNVGLDLPDVGYDRNPPMEVLTAAGIGSFTQIPKKGSLSGFVYEDVNNNGIKETGEKGIVGAKLSLWVWDGTKYTNTGLIETTKSDGSYLFNDLDPNKLYRITEYQPDGYLDGLDTAGSLGGTAVNPGDEITDIPVGINQHGTDYNFGELKPGSLSGHVYEDSNCDGTMQPGEKGIIGIELTLWVWDGNKYVNTGITKITDKDGFYAFTNLDPFKKYQITEKQPSHDDPPHYFEGKEHVGTLGGVALSPPENTITEIYVGFGQNGTEYDFAERLPGSLSGYVYEDKNNNGIKETGEPGLEKVILTLYVLDTTTGKYVSTNRTTKTNSDGFYLFDDLDPCQKYAVRETQPDNYIDGKDTPGPNGGKVEENDYIVDIPVRPDTESGENNFGELRPSSLSGYVFQDGDTVHLYPNDPNPTIAPPNWNGAFNSGVKRLAGVVLILADAKGNPLKDANGNLIQVKTDSEGYYEFTMLTEGVYSVIEVQPGGYLDGIDTPGSNGGLAINAYDTVTIALLKSQGVNVDALNNDAIVGITLGYADSSTRNNFSEVYVLRDLIPPTPNPGPDNPIPHYTPDPVRGITGQFAPFPYAPYQYNSSVDLVGSEKGGGGIAESSYTWHLSVVNAGFPRGEGADDSQVSSNTNVSAKFQNVSWRPISLNKGKWVIRDKNGNPVRLTTFGLDGGKPIAGDFNGDGIAQVAIYRDGVWYIDLNSNGIWDEEDLIAEMGTMTDQPIVGDWDGDGKVDIGIFGPEWTGDRNAIERDPGLPSDLNNRKIAGARPKNIPPEVHEATLGHRALRRTAQGPVRTDLIDHVFEYGGKGDYAFSGDFTGDGITNIGVYRNGSFFVDRKGDGRWDEKNDIYIADVGRPGEVPVIGDFNGDGIDEIGLYKDGYWRLDTTGDFKLDTEIRFGEIGDIPVVGDFTGDGYTQIGIYRPNEDMDSGLYTQNDLQQEQPQPLYGSQYNPNGPTRPDSDIPSETIRGSLPQDHSNRAERTPFSP